MLLAAAGAAGAQEATGVVVAEEGFRRGTDPVGAFAVPERNRRLVSEGRPKPGDVREQTGDVLEMMNTALEKGWYVDGKCLEGAGGAGGSGTQLGAMNEVYNTFFKEPRPARRWGMARPRRM